MRKCGNRPEHLQQRQLEPIVLAVLVDAVDKKLAAAEGLHRTRHLTMNMAMTRDQQLFYPEWSYNKMNRTGVANPPGYQMQRVMVAP